MWFYGIILAVVLASWYSYEQGLIQEGWDKATAYYEKVSAKAQKKRTDRANTVRGRAIQRSSKPSRCKTGKCFVDEFDRTFK